MGHYSPLSILVFFVMGYFYSEVVSQGFSDYNTLTTNLFMNYEKRTRPSTAGSATAVYMIFEPSSIMSLDESEQVLYTYATLKCQWDDDTLSWDPSNYSGITNFLWPQDDVWLPDLVITNSVKDARRLGFKEMPVRVESSGAVAWFPSMILATSCDMDITYYPFDTQKCNIILSTTMSTYEEISILPKGEPISWAEYSPGGSWDLKSIVATALDNQGDLTRIQFELTLKRLRTYYVMNIILPVIFLSLTASLVFYLPADAGEKIGMSMTVLLAYAVYLTIIADNMPQTSLQVSLLAVYLTILLGFTAFGVILSVVVLALHYKSDDIPVGHMTASVTRTIRRMLRLGRQPKIPGNRVSPQPGAPSPSLRHTDIAVDSHGFSQSLSTSEKQMILQDSQASRGPVSSSLPPVAENCGGKAQSYPKVTDVSSLGSELELETITWTKVAEAVDRSLFLTFSALVFFLTLFMLPYMALKAD